ncbi:MAG: hypothetical protein IJU84_02550 [Clostridia bacterium]|nr:hypothetical protein [Clostridia bacterium]
MKDTKIYDECYHNSVREKVAKFIDNSPLLNNFNGEKYFELEDSIVDLVKDVTSIQEKRPDGSKHAVYMVLFDWSTDDADGIETFLFYNYDAAYKKFKDIMTDECNTELSWVGENALTGNMEAADGYILDYLDITTGETEVYFHVAEEGNYYNHSFIDLIKKEIIL